MRDRVLARFGKLLHEFAGDQDTAIRLGGEEFCLVLPNTDQAGAITAAERLRTATSQQPTDIVPGGVTVSIGIALNRPGVLNARAFLRSQTAAFTSPSKPAAIAPRWLQNEFRRRRATAPPSFVAQECSVAEAEGSLRRSLGVAR